MRFKLAETAADPLAIWRLASKFAVNFDRRIFSRKGAKGAAGKVLDTC